MGEPVATPGQAYQNARILTMIPEEQTEVALRTQSRWSALLAILDLLLPDFHGPQLRLYAHTIEQMGCDEVSDHATLLQLDH